MFRDVLTALKEMGLATLSFIGFGARVLFWIVVCVGVAWLSHYCVITWPRQTGTVFILAALTTWFMIELNIARADRLQDERSRISPNRDGW